MCERLSTVIILLLPSFQIMAAAGHCFLASGGLLLFMVTAAAPKGFTILALLAFMTTNNSVKYVIIVSWFQIQNNPLMVYILWTLSISNFCLPVSSQVCIQFAEDPQKKMQFYVFYYHFTIEVEHIEISCWWDSFCSQVSLIH